jgi:hypothetical protein
MYQLKWKEKGLPYFGSDQLHVLERLKCPNTRRHPMFELPNIQYTVELPFNDPQFEGLTHLRFEKVDNFSIFLNLAFMSILPQRNIKQGFSCNGVHKENKNILPDCFVMSMKPCLSCQPFTSKVHVSVRWNLFRPAPSNILVHINSASRSARTHYPKYSKAECTYLLDVCIDFTATWCNWSPQFFLSPATVQYQLHHEW